MLRFILCLFLVLMVTRPVLAEERLPAAFVAPLMQWVANKVAVPVTVLPNVFVSRERMISKIGDPQRQAAQQAAMARALYVPHEIDIDEEFWDASDTRTVSFLVHELVHHAQYVSGRPYACNNAKEWEAYKLQNIWLAEQGLPPAVEESWITRMADCSRSYVFSR